MDIPYVRLTKERLRANIQYAVLFLPDRMVFVKIGGQFAEGGKEDLKERFLYATSPATPYKDLAKGKLIRVTPPSVVEATAREKSANDEKVRKLSQLPAEELLALDKANFELFHSDIRLVEIKKANFMGQKGIFTEAKNGHLAIEGDKKEKFLVSPVQDLEECIAIFEKFLPGKVRTKN
jgi:hypothetical protein